MIITIKLIVILIIVTLTAPKFTGTYEIKIIRAYLINRAITFVLKVYVITKLQHVIKNYYIYFIWFYYY